MHSVLVFTITMIISLAAITVGGVWQSRQVIPAANTPSQHSSQITSASAWRNQCRNGWSTFDGASHCYYFSISNADWHKAQFECHLRNARLVEIDSLAVHRHLLRETRKRHSVKRRFLYWWIGLHDRQIEGQFRWDRSGVPLSAELSTLWALREPSSKATGTNFVLAADDSSSSADSEDCAALFTAHGAKKLVGWRAYVDHWFDLDCGAVYRDESAYICQRPRTSMPPVGLVVGDTFIRSTRLPAQLRDTLLNDAERTATDTTTIASLGRLVEELFHESSAWPDGVVPLLVDSSVDVYATVQLLNLTWHVETATDCRVRFKQISTRDASDELWSTRPFVHVVSPTILDMGSLDADSLCVYEGFGAPASGSLRKPLLLVGSRCAESDYQAELLAALLHLVGLPNEHQRPDRDRFVAVQWKNIESSRAPAFWRFGAWEPDWLALPYDAMSATHSDDAKRVPTHGSGTFVGMYSLDGKWWPSVRDSGRILSDVDVQKIELRYKTTGVCGTSTPLKETAIEEPKPIIPMPLPIEPSRTRRVIDKWSRRLSPLLSSTITARSGKMSGRYRPASRRQLLQMECPVLPKATVIHTVTAVRTVTSTATTARTVIDKITTVRTVTVTAAPAMMTPRRHYLPTSRTTTAAPIRRNRAPPPRRLTSRAEPARSLLWRSRKRSGSLGSRLIYGQYGGVSQYSLG